MTIYDEDLWARISPKMHTKELTTKYGAAAWVDAYLRFRFAKSAQAKLFAGQILQLLDCRFATTVDVSPTAVAETLNAYMDAPIEELEKRIEEARNAKDDFALLYLFEILKCLEAQRSGAWPQG